MDNVERVARAWSNVRNVSHDEAAEIASRLIAGAFNRTDKRPNFSIPCRPDHDDDCLILAYIEQQKAAASAMEGWRPIKEAPVRTALIGWGESWAAPELIWKATESEPWQEGEWGDYFDLGFEPTHFQRLPAPPQHGGEDI